MASLNDQPARGHCLCGAVRFEVLAAPIVVSLCHCESCRRHTGSMAAPFAIFRKDAVRWSGAERVRFCSSPPVVRSFCGHCGSPLAYEHDEDPGEIELYLGTFDDPARFPVRRHANYGERVPWFDTMDQTPRYDESSQSGEPPISLGPAAVSSPASADQQ